jgi:SAM-dependent methyltransferase
MAPAFLAWLNYAPGLRWLDVGCGTGALSTAIIELASPASIFGLEPSWGFIRTARRSLVGKAMLLQGTGKNIPIEDYSVDAVVSGLVLNFIDEPGTALEEMMRVTRPKGIIAAYVWDYAEKMEMLRLFWDAARTFDPGAASLDEGSRFPLCRPEALKDLYTSMGLRKVDTAAVEISTVFTSFDDFWLPFLGGQGPAPTYVKSLDSTHRERLRNHLYDHLPMGADGSFSLTARAWAVRGIV